MDQLELIEFAKKLASDESVESDIKKLAHAFLWCNHNRQEAYADNKILRTELKNLRNDYKLLKEKKEV